MSRAVFPPGAFAPGAGVTYLNHAAAGLLPVRTRDALTSMVSEQSARGVLGFVPLELELDAYRTRIGAFVGAGGDEIAFLRNTGDGANVVALGLGLGPGDEIVTNDNEFGANAIPWLELRRAGVVVRMIETAKERMTPDVLRRHVGARTRVVAVSWVSFADGYRHDLAALAEVAHAAGALFCVDAIQALGAFDVDVRRDGIDVLYAGGAKWLLALPGVSMVYVARELHERIVPRVRGWRDVADIWNFFDYDQQLAPSAARYEGGTQNFLGILALDESIALLRETGVAAISTHVLGLTDRLVEGLERLGATIATPRGAGISSGIVTATLPGHDSVELGRRLGEQGFITTFRPSGIRFSPHGHNTVEQIDGVLEALAQA